MPKTKIRGHIAMTRRSPGSRIPEDIGALECKTDNGEIARMHETDTYANAMHMMI